MRITIGNVSGTVVSDHNKSYDVMTLMAHWDGLAWATIDSGLDPVARGIFGIGNKNL